MQLIVSGGKLLSSLAQVQYLSMHARQRHCLANTSVFLLKKNLNARILLVMEHFFDCDLATSA